LTNATVNNLEAFLVPVAYQGVRESHIGDSDLSLYIQINKSKKPKEP
jgi:hypothetical protein